MWGNPTLIHLAKSTEKILRKDKYWHSQLRKFFDRSAEHSLNLKNLFNSFLTNVPLT